MLLEGKKVLVTGVLTPKSIAFDVARVAQEQGAEVVLTGFGRAKSLTEKTARRLPQPPEVLEMDANDESQIQAVADELRTRWGRVDGLLHAIAYTPEDGLGGAFLRTPWETVATSVRTGAFSLKAVTVGLLELFVEGGGVVSLDFDASQAWPAYDWMGVSKAALESVTRYLAAYVGPRNVRVNCVSAGPLRTMAAKGIPGFDRLAGAWETRAPLGWDVTDPEPVARTVVFLLSDWAKAITGEIVHVDGGFHAIGAELPTVAEGPPASPAPEA